MWTPVIAICMFLFYWSSQQHAVISDVKSVDNVLRKCVHFIAYGVLAASVYRATKSYKIAFVFSILYGATDEIHQMFTPTRSAKITDIAIDGLGAIFALFILWKLLQIVPNKLKKLLFPLL